MWGFPKIRGTLFGVPIIRIIVYWGLQWGPLIWGKYHVKKNILLFGKEGKTIPTSCLWELEGSNRCAWEIGTCPFFGRV